MCPCILARDPIYKYFHIYMNQLHNEIKQQNATLQANIMQKLEDDSSDDKYTLYALQDIGTLQMVNGYLFIIFYVVAAGVGVLILTNSTWNIYVRLFAVILILLFPFVIYTAEYGIYYLAGYLYSLVTFTPFNSGYLYPYQPKSYETPFNNRYYQL